MSQEARGRLLEKVKLELIENAKFKAWERARLREESDYWVDQTETEVVVGIEIEDTTDSSKTQGLEMDTQEKIQNAEKKSNMDIKYARVLENVNPQNEDELPLRKGDMLIVLEKHSKEGWWKGQLGSKVGYFPEKAVEFVSEEEVVKFLESTKLGVVSKKKVLRKSSQKTKQELVDEMNQLQKNLKETQQKIKTIQQEIEQLKTQRHQLQKKYKEKSSQFSCSYYGIDPLQMFYFDILKIVRLLEENSLKEKELKSTVDTFIDDISTFISEFKKECATDSKLKTNAEKIITKIQNFQALLVNQRANFDTQHANEFYKVLLDFSNEVKQEYNKTRKSTPVSSSTEKNDQKQTKRVSDKKQSKRESDKKQSKRESDKKSTTEVKTTGKKETKVKDNTSSLDGEKNKDNTKEKSTNMSEKDSNNKN